MPSQPSIPAQTFNPRAPFGYTVEDAVTGFPLREEEINFSPVEIFPANVFQLDHIHTKGLALPEDAIVWVTLVVVDKKTGAPSGQFVLQAKAHSLGPKVSGKRDGSVGLGAWVYSKLHPQDLQPTVFLPGILGFRPTASLK